MQLVIVQTVGELESGSSYIFSNQQTLLVLIRPKIGTIQLLHLIKSKKKLSSVKTSGIGALAISIIAYLLGIKIYTSVNFISPESSKTGKYIGKLSHNYFADSIANFPYDISNGKYCLRDESLTSKTLVKLLKIAINSRNESSTEPRVYVIGKHVDRSKSGIKALYLEVLREACNFTRVIYSPHPREVERSIYYPLQVTENYPYLEILKDDTVIVLGGSSSVTLREIHGNHIHIILVGDAIFNRNQKRLTQARMAADVTVYTPEQLAFEVKGRLWLQS